MKTRAAVLYGAHQPWLVKEVDLDDPRRDEARSWSRPTRLACATPMSTWSLVISAQPTRQVAPLCCLSSAGTRGPVW